MLELAGDITGGLYWEFRSNGSGTLDWYGAPSSRAPIETGTLEFEWRPNDRQLIVNDLEPANVQILPGGMILRTPDTPVEA